MIRKETRFTRTINDAKIEDWLEVKNWEFKPCPFCGSTDIGVKDTILDLRMGADCPSTAIRSIWAYCRYCEAEGRKKTAEVIGYDDEIAVAVEGWNERDIPKAKLEDKGQ